MGRNTSRRQLHLRPRLTALLDDEGQQAVHVLLADPAEVRGQVSEVWSTNLPELTHDRQHQARVERGREAFGSGFGLLPGRHAIQRVRLQRRL